jgi:hypothetical protein
VLDISGKLLDLVLNISPISKGILEFATHAKTGEVDPDGSRLIETMTGQLDRFLYNPHLYATPTLRPNQLRASFSELSNRIVGYLHPPGIIPFPPLGEIPNQIGQIAAIKLGGFQSLTEALARLNNCKRSESQEERLNIYNDRVTRMRNTLIPLLQGLRRMATEV